jgi:hypothetical protein
MAGQDHRATEDQTTGQKFTIQMTLYVDLVRRVPLDGSL